MSVPASTRRGRLGRRAGLLSLAGATAVILALLAAGVHSDRTGPLAAGLPGPAAADGTVDGTSGAAAGPPLPVQPGPGLPDGDGTLEHLRVGGQWRSYLLLPALGLPAGRPAALLVVLHPDAAMVRDVAVTMGFDSLRRQGVTLVYPAGIGGTWNAGDCCGLARRRGVDDVAFVSDLLADVNRYTPVDPARRAVLGYSGGGMLVYRLLCSPHPRLLAAVEVNGSLEAPCGGGITVPDLLALHGALDGSIGLVHPVYVSRLGIAPRPVQATLDRVTASAGCRDRSTSDDGVLRQTWWRACRGGSTVQAVVVLAAGHRWEDVGGAARTRGWLLARLVPNSA